MGRSGRPRKVLADSDGRLAEALRAQRDRLGLTRTQVASLARLSPNTLMALEQGRTSDPGFFKVASLCRALNIRLDDLHAATCHASTTKGHVMTHGIVSIGYQGRDIEGFVDELVAAGVDTVADVRLNPISRKPGFSKTRLTNALADAGIGYLHLRGLGNPKSNREPFWSGRVEEGKQVFRGLLGNDDAATALSDLAKLAKEQVVAVLCFEGEHEQCHRQVVIDEVTKQEPMPVLALR